MCQLRLKGSNGVGQRLLFFLRNWAREQRALLQSKCVTFLKNLHLLQLGDQHVLSRAPRARRIVIMPLQMI